MKKMIFTLLCCTLLLTACGAPDEELTAGPETEVSTEENTDEDNHLTEKEPDPDEEDIPAGPAEEPEEDDVEQVESVLGHPISYADVTNDSQSDTTGQRAYIEISKEDLLDMNEDQYSELCTYVDTLGNNWFTVSCDDGTGLVFTGCSSAIVTYGHLDDSGRIDTNIGDIVKSGESFTYTEAQSKSQDTTSIQAENDPPINASEIPSTNNIETPEPTVDTEINTQPEETAVVETPPAPEPESETPVGETVWLSATGSKYHRINNCGRMNPDKARQVSLNEAQSMGYERCSKCY